MEKHQWNGGIPMVKTMGKPWKNHGKTMGKPWKNHGKTMGKTMEKPWVSDPFATETRHHSSTAHSDCTETSSPRTAAAAEAIDRTKRLPRKKTKHVQPSAGYTLRKIMVMFHMIFHQQNRSGFLLTSAGDWQNILKPSSVWLSIGYSMTIQCSPWTQRDNFSHEKKYPKKLGGNEQKLGLTLFNSWHFAKRNVRINQRCGMYQQKLWLTVIMSRNLDQNICLDKSE